MIFKYKKLMACILLASSTSVFSAGAAVSLINKTAGGDKLEKLLELLGNVGKYNGTDVAHYCGGEGGACTEDSNEVYSAALINDKNTSLVQLNLLISYIGSIIGGVSTDNSNGAQANNPLIPMGAGESDKVSAGATFMKQPPNDSAYSSPNTTTGVSVSTMIDQAPYQQDPVSQSIYNTLTTPGASYCNINSSDYKQCTLLYREQIMFNSIGQLPDLNPSTPWMANIFNDASNANLVAQLNPDTLLSPLLYTTTPSNQQSTSGKNATSLPSSATSQAQQAQNYIRFATSAINPINLPTNQALTNLMNQMYQNQNNQTGAQAFAQIYGYLTKLETYTAQTSIAVSNLYYSLSRRLPQKTLNGSDKPTSEALNEYIMATWRMYNPNKGKDEQQWVETINTASPATVQKEMAVLLSEINYQLYLMRQQQERLLITQSMFLLQSSQMNQPDPSLGGDNSQSTSTTTPPPSK